MSETVGWILVLWIPLAFVIIGVVVKGQKK